LGSTRKVIKLGETVEITSHTPPSPMKATPTRIASDSNDVSTESVSKAGDVMMTSFSEAGEVMMTSSNQKGKLLNSLSAMDGHDHPLKN
jgi:hypothetical protein